MESEKQTTPIEEVIQPQLTLGGQNNLSECLQINYDHSDTTAVEGVPSKWMERSRLRSHFRISEEAGQKIANCIHCKKSFKESKSTGNLWKHIKNIHPFEAKAQSSSEMKTRTLDSLSIKGRSLPLPSNFISACRNNPGEIGVISLITEKLLPFSVVEAAAWKWIDKACPEINLMCSRTTVSEKLAKYSKFFDEALVSSLKYTDFINVEIDIWTGGNGRSYLAIAASFVPNLLNEKMLNNAGDIRPLLNNNEQAQNSHLLDFVDVSDFRHTGENLFKAIVAVLDAYQITHKIATITSDNATNNICMHSHLIHDYLKVLKPEAYRRLNDCHLIRCSNHVLNLLFLSIIKSLKTDIHFGKALIDVTKLAKILKKSSLLRASLSQEGLPLIPLAPETRWLYVWKQLDAYLKHRNQYLVWLEKLQNSSPHERLATKIRQHIELAPETQHLLQYFVDSCSIFNYLNDHLQNNDFNRLPNSASFYYIMKEFYRLCSCAGSEDITPALESTFDFTFINGKSALPSEIKRQVLQAILSSKSKFDQYFEYFKESDIYFVAAFLDPTSRYDTFDQLMMEDEADNHLKRVELYVKSYLGRCRSTKTFSVDSLPSKRPKQAKVRINKLPLVSARKTASVDTSTLQSSRALEEWDGYKRESQIASDSTVDALKWWYSRRSIYPNLFRLAIPLFYTKISTCGIERTFSISGKLMRKDRRSLGSANTKRTMLLRNRFANYGLYNRELEICTSVSDDTLIILSDSSEDEWESNSD